MTMQSMTLPTELKSSVTPMDNPTVPKAEMVSNNTGKKGIFSVMDNKNNAVKITQELTAPIAMERTIISALIVRLKICGSFMPLK